MGDPYQLPFAPAQVIKDHGGSDERFRAEIFVPRLPMQFNADGKPRTKHILGPSRVNRDWAEEDAKKLQEASPNGPMAVRSLADALLHTHRVKSEGLFR